MAEKLRYNAQWIVPVMVIGLCLLAFFAFARPVSAITQIPTPDPQPGSFGLEATKRQEPPKEGARITNPSNGASFSTSPITVNGICPADLLVEVFNNNVMVGATVCSSGSFTMQVSLFAGTNELTSLVYDGLDQAGPVSNIATVTYTDTSFTSFGELVTLTSSYGRRSAATGAPLTWPLQLSGGAGPYAFSIDWGDNTDIVLKSQSLAGVVGIDHTYKKAGIYQANIRVTDTNGVSAFLQVVAVGSGEVDSAALAADENTPQSTTKVLWIPAAVALLLLFPTYWLGRRSQLVSLRNKLLKEQAKFAEK